MINHGYMMTQGLVMGVEFMIQVILMKQCLLHQNTEDVLPPNQGELPPIDTTKIIREPGNPVIIGNRLNILMENEDKSIMDLAKEFKEKYPDNKYKVVYYDDVVKRMQIEVPAKKG